MEDLSLFSVNIEAIEHWFYQKWNNKPYYNHSIRFRNITVCSSHACLGIWECHWLAAWSATHMNVHVTSRSQLHNLFLNVVVAGSMQLSKLKLHLLHHACASCLDARSPLYALQADICKICCNKPQIWCEKREKTWVLSFTRSVFSQSWA